MNPIRSINVKKTKLVSLVEQLNKARILVVGDVMLDRFVYGEILRISPEAPVPVLRAGETKPVLGGAGNVVRNLLSLGSYVSFISVIGDDPEGIEIRDLLSNYNRLHTSLIVERKRKTTLKTRFIAERQQVLRVDSETTQFIEREAQNRISQAVRDLINSCNVILISDYGKGLLCPEILSDVISTVRRNNKPLFIDPKSADYTRYHGATMLTPNLKELKEATRMPVAGDEEIVIAAKDLIDSCELDAILVTRGKEGMTLVQSSGKATHLKAEAREVFDVTGAGDTVIAVMSAAYGAGASLTEAAELANIAAGIVVGKIGTAVVYPNDLIKAIHYQELSSAEAKVLDIDTAIDRVEIWRRKGYKVGFTNGIFDLLHPGHISLLSQAAKACDRLIVGLNGDMSVRSLNGEGPVQHESARSAILASLEVVDAVIIFQDETPLRLLDTLRPDVLIKGANYKPEEVVGADLVKSYGGKVLLADIMDIYTTNSTIAKITNGTF